MTDATGGRGAIDGMIGGGAIAYAGFEGKIPLFSPQQGSQQFSLGITGAAGLALGGGLDFEVRHGSFTVFGYEKAVRYFVPTALNPFLGIGIGGALKLESPSPSTTLIEVNVDQAGNITNGGILGGRRP